MTAKDREQIKTLIERSLNVVEESRKNSEAREEFLKDTERDLEKPMRRLRRMGYRPHS